MAKSQINFGELGGGAEVKMKTDTLSPNTTLIESNVGNAEKFFFITQNSSTSGSILTNVNPTTGEVLTNQSYRYYTNQGTWNVDSTWYIYKDSNNDVRLNTAWSTSSSFKYVLVYG